MLKRFYRFGQVAGVAVHIGPDGHFTIDGCLLELKGDDLSTAKSFGGLSDLNALKKHLPEKTIVALNIFGKGILSKKVAISETTLPNVKPEEFDMQYADSGDHRFISVIRRTEAERWFNQFKAIGLLPVSLSLGPFAVMNMDRELNGQGGQLVFNGHMIDRDEQGNWTDARYKNDAKAPYKIKLQHETIAEHVLLPYATAFQLILDSQLQRIATVSEPFDVLHLQRTEQQKFKVRAAAILFVTFVLLLINFGVFSWLSSANTRLSDQLSRMQQSSTDVQATLEDVKVKEELLRTLGWDDDVPKAKLIGQIASMLPADVRWTAVMIDPVKAVQGQGADQIGFATNTIKVEGTADKVLSVNEWLARIRTRPWVKQARLDRYSFDNQQNTGVFTLMISY